MSIKHAVLGLIAESPKHGYAVHAEFVDRLGDFWELNYGQVYQVLTTLEREGLIVGVDERVGRRPLRRVYSISARGRTALRTWLKEPTSRARPFRDDFYVRLLFVGDDDPEFIRSMLTKQLGRCRGHLRELLDRRKAIKEAAGQTSACRLFTEAAILHADADVKALELCQAELVGRDPRRGNTQPAAEERSKQALGRP